MCGVPALIAVRVRLSAGLRVLRLEGFSGFSGLGFRAEGFSLGLV